MTTRCKHPDTMHLRRFDEIDPVSRIVATTGKAFGLIAQRIHPVASFEGDVYCGVCGRRLYA